MANLTNDELFELSHAFHKAAVAVGEVRFAKWNQLTDKDRVVLEDNQWTLLDMSSNFNARSALLSLELLEEQVAAITSVTTEIGKTVTKIKSIKKAIKFSAKVIAFGGALASGNVGAMLAAGSDLLGE